MAQGTYFELNFQGPWKGMNVMEPENVMEPGYAPFLNNVILKNKEIRPRFKASLGILGTPDNKPASMITSFMDSNGVIHTVIDNPTGLWQLNRQYLKYPKKAWNLIGVYPTQPGTGVPDAYQVFVNKLYWTNGGNNLWQWDGITSVGEVAAWPKNTNVFLNNRIVDSNGNVQICNKAGKTAGVAPAWMMAVGAGTADGTASWVNNGKPAPSNGFISTAVVDATNGITAGAYFLGELNAQLIMLSTLEGIGSIFNSYPQRVRWCPSGLPNIWDPNVNLGAGYVDELDVPDAITGFLTIGRTGFIFRVNGITEMLQGTSGLNPWTFNHLWASDRGIGNIYPYTVAGYGPVGIFASNDDFYELSLGGFKGIGGMALDAIFNDLAEASSGPVASMVPFWQMNYIYPCYKLDIPMSNFSSVSWIYFVKEQIWMRWTEEEGIFTGKTRYCVNS